MDRKIRPQYVTKVYQTSRTFYTKRKNGHTLTTCFLHIATDNPESEANRNLDKSKKKLLSVTWDNRSEVVFEMAGPAFDRCVTGHPSFRFMTPLQRDKLIILLCRTMANVSSRVLAYQLNIGLNPRQIGQIRRWHNEFWRTTSPKI